MNLNQLQYFKILAQEEHYTRAAQMLSITQPSLSHAIAQLEEELGTRLFEKKGRNIVLTRYGKLFLPYVEESLKVLEEGVQRTRELNGSCVPVSVSIGAAINKEYDPSYFEYYRAADKAMYQAKKNEKGSYVKTIF